MNLSHKQLAAWYLQLYQMLEAGLMLSQAIGSAHGPRTEDRQAMAAQLGGGSSVEAVMDAAPSWLPKADRLFIKAAAQSGRLPQTFHLLAERHKRIGDGQMKGILATLYPLGVLHLGILIFPILGMIDSQQGFQFSITRYAGEVFLTLGPLWAGILLLVYLVKVESPVIPTLMNLLPGLRGYYRGQSMADLAYALEGFLEAGLGIGESWALAGGITGNRKLKRAAAEMRNIVADGGQPSQHLARLGCFPGDFVSLYTSGEQTGKLTSSLAAIARSYTGKANTCLGLAMVLYPLIIFLIVVGIIISQVLGFYGGYFENINRMMQ